MKLLREYIKRCLLRRGQRLRIFDRWPAPALRSSTPIIAWLAPWFVPLFAVTLATLAVSGCISVNIGPKPGERSSKVAFQAPPAPFTAIKAARADGAWQNPQNGNSISFLSTCNDPADPTLESVAREISSELREPKTLRSETVTYNNREALDNEVEAKAEGVPTRIRTVIFKKNGCLYTLSYIGVAPKFGENRAQFEDFLKAFDAP